MSLDQTEFASLVLEMQPKLLFAEFIDSFQDGERKVFLTFKKSQSEFFTLLLCLQEPFLRFHLMTQKVKHEQGSFSRTLFFHLKGSLLTKVEQISHDRILLLTFEKKTEKHYLIGEFFAKRPNLYLTDAEWKILGSVNKSTLEFYQFPPPREHSSSVGTFATHAEVEQRYDELEKDAHFQKEKHLLQKEIKEKQKRCTRTIEKNSEELKHLSGWERVKHEGELLLANLYRVKKGMNSVVLQDWSGEGLEIEVQLDKKLNPSDQVAALFKKAKKMRSGIDRCTLLIAQTSESLNHWEKALQASENAINSEELQRVRQNWAIFTPEKKEQKTALPFYEFLTEAGLKVWVGKGAKENEKLTFSFAKGSDFWLHVRDYPGAHVVIQVAKRLRPDEESIKDAAQLALAYSQAKDKGIVEILITQCKFVSRFGNKKGQVSTSSREFIQAQFDPQRFQSIKNRKKNL